MPGNQEAPEASVGRRAAFAAGLLALGLLAPSGCGAPADEAPEGAEVEVVADDSLAPGIPPGVEAEPEPEATSLLGESLYPPPLPPEVREEREADLRAARAALEEAPGDPEALIWVGRRQAYLGRYRDAIATFTEGIERFPADPRFLRHRGHRWITVREFERAIEDLTAAEAPARGRLDEIEPDGMPNPAGIPLSTLGFNIRYHRALARYLSGDFGAAREDWEATVDVSGNPDLRVASLYWLHLTLRRLGDEEAAEAAILEVTPATEVIENGTYRDLILYFRGMAERTDVLPDGDEGLGTVTALYGVGARALLDGDEAEARGIFQQILERPDQWAAFGYVAAEAEVARHGW